MKHLFKTLLALSLTASILHAAPVSPSDAALDFMEKIRAGSVNLSVGKGTAISKQTSRNKVSEIKDRLESMQGELANCELSAAEEIIDEPFAASVIIAKDRFDSRNVQPYAVALLHKGEKWLPCPLPASFDNTGTSYLLENHAKLEKLVHWMVAKESADLEKLREMSAAAAKAKYLKALPAGGLENMTPSEVLDCFTQAAAKRDGNALLALLGGAADILPENWNLRAEGVKELLNTKEDLRPSLFWHVLTAPQILRAVVQEDAAQDSATYQIAWLDPSTGMGKHKLSAGIIHIVITRARGRLWRVDPPELFYNHEVKLEHDESIFQKLPAKLAEMHPPQPQKSPQVLALALVRALAGKLPAAWLPLIARPGDDLADNVAALEDAASYWWKRKGDGLAAHMEVLETKVDGDAAVALCLAYSSTMQPSPGRVFAIHIVKQGDGWLWQPATTGEQNETLQKWAHQQTADLEQTWQSRLLSDSVVIDDAKPAAPDEAAAKKIANAYFDALGKNDLRAALRCTARFAPKHDNASTLALEELLKNVSYDISRAQRNNRPPDMKIVKVGNVSTSLGMAVPDSEGNAFPLYTTISTPQGPRILIGYDLQLQDTRTRKFLNRTILDTLAETHAPLAKDIKTALADFQNALDKPAKE